MALNETLALLNNPVITISGPTEDEQRKTILEAMRERDEAREAAARPFETLQRQGFTVRERPSSEAEELLAIKDAVDLCVGWPSEEERARGQYVEHIERTAREIADMGRKLVAAESDRDTWKASAEKAATELADLRKATFGGDPSRWPDTETDLRAKLTAAESESADRKRIIDDIASALHPHWNGRGHGYVPEQLAGMAASAEKQAQSWRELFPRVERCWDAVARIPRAGKAVEGIDEAVVEIVDRLTAAEARDGEAPTATVAGDVMDRSLADFERACAVHIDDEQQKPAPDNALIGLLCDAVRLSMEYAARRDELHAQLNRAYSEKGHVFEQLTAATAKLTAAEGLASQREQEWRAIAAHLLPVATYAEPLAETAARIVGKLAAAEATIARIREAERVYVLSSADNRDDRLDFILATRSALQTPPSYFRAAPSQPREPIPADAMKQFVAEHQELERLRPGAPRDGLQVILSAMDQAAQRKIQDHETASLTPAERQAVEVLQVPGLYQEADGDGKRGEGRVAGVAVERCGECARRQIVAHHDGPCPWTAETPEAGGKA